MSKKWRVTLFILVIMVVVAIGTAFYYTYQPKTARTRQAVFLTNGQVYFGYVANPKAQVVKITNIYYLKTQDLLQNATDQKDTSKKVSLVKLGNELHGPTDEMLINRDQILFIEDMRADSKVNDAIKRYAVTNSSSTK